jgi:hypothetical protein
MKLGFGGASGEGVLIGREPRAAVDLDRAVGIDQRSVGPFLAHAGERNGGPGPGWLGPELRAHAEECAGGARGGWAGP